MGERREDSVLLALNELKKIQEDRRREEEEEERKKAEELRLAREAEARRLVEEEERRKREEEQRVRHEQDERERLEREERMRVAAEAAKAEAEARVKAEHELNLHQAALEAQHKRKIPWVPIGIVGVVLAVIVGVVIKTKSDEAKQAMMLAKQAAEDARKAEMETERLQALMEQSERRAKELEDKLARATTDEEREALKRELGAERERQKKIRSRSKQAPKAPTKKGIQIDLKGDDPLQGL